MLTSIADLTSNAHCRYPLYITTLCSACNATAASNAHCVPSAAYVQVPTLYRLCCIATTHAYDAAVLRRAGVPEYLIEAMFRAVAKVGGRHTEMAFALMMPTVSSQQAMWRSGPVQLVLAIVRTMAGVH